MSEHQIRIYGGYFENLLFSLAMNIVRAPSLEQKEAILQLLEEEFCALSEAFPNISSFYMNFTKNILSKTFPDLSLPELEGCFLYSQVLRFIIENAERVFKEEYKFMVKEDIERGARINALRICRSALLASLYKAAIIPLRR